MIINSKHNKSFISNSLTKQKYNELHDFAVLINKHKNIVSQEVNSNLLSYLDLNFFDFLKLMRAKYKTIIPSNFDKQLYEDVFTAYQNKFDNLTKSIRFEKVNFLGFYLYKRDSKNNKKGDFKKVNTKKETTPLSICLTYLARYGDENTIEYVNKQLSNANLKEDKIKFYEHILNYINKFGFDRLFSLSLQKRKRILNKYNNPIEFKSLTFKGRSRLVNIISYNKNYNSEINSFISLSWLERGKRLEIPVKFSKDYHGNMKDYHKNTPDYEYTIVFTDKGKVKINICKDGTREIHENKTNYVGIDVNVKHNLFTLSDGNNFDYDRKLLNKLVIELLKIDELKKNKEYSVGKNKQRKINSIRNKIKHSTETICVNLCKHLNNNNLNHVVFENLNNSFGRSFVKDKDINFNRIVKELHLSSLKDMFGHISIKYGISVSTVHPEYTSKTCSVCGCIDDGNRLTQEEFKCVECGYENNADVNAAINIKQRVSSTVLRGKLLKQNKIGNGSFEPKVLKRDKVKEILLSFRYKPEMVMKVSSTQ